MSSDEGGRVDRPRLVLIGRSYTKGRRQPYLIRKWPGSNTTLPLGPYTLSQLVLLVGTTYLLVTLRDYWTFFGPFNLVIGVGLPIGLAFAARHTRIEGRDPLRAAAAGLTYVTQPKAGYIKGQPWRPAKPTKVHSRRFRVVQYLPHIEVADVPVTVGAAPVTAHVQQLSPTALALLARKRQTASVQQNTGAAAPGSALEYLLSLSARDGS